MNKLLILLLFLLIGRLEQLYLCRGQSNPGIRLDPTVNVVFLPSAE